MLNRAITASLDGFERIASSKDASIFYANTLSAAVFPSNSLVNGLPKFSVPFLIGPLRIRTLRSRTTTCPSSYTSSVCYLEYSQSNQQTSDLPAGFPPWRTFRSESETGISSVIQGKVSEYDGSGYIMDVFNTTAEEFRQLWYSMQQGHYLDSSVRALICSAVGFEPAQGIWWQVDLLLEFSISGGCVPSPVTLRSFHPQSSTSSVTLEALRLVCSMHLLYYILTEFAVRVSLTWRFHWKYFFTCYFFRDFAIFVLILTEFSLSMSLNIDPAELLHTSHFHDLRAHSETESTCKQLNLVSVMLLFLRFSMVFRH